jgi:uncharacterized coiled-coil protein SlyX
VTDVQREQILEREAVIERLEGQLDAARATIENLNVCLEETRRELHRAQERISHLEALPS